jgi:hypothetical protein
MMMKIKRILCICLSLLVFSTSFAGEFTYYLLNSASSINNPITVTSGYIEYHQNGSDLSCSGTELISEIVGYNPKVSVGTQFKISFTPRVPDRCYMAGMLIDLVIETVDNKGIDEICSNVYVSYDPLEDFSGQTTEITETNDHFFCTIMIGKPNAF